MKSTILMCRLLHSSTRLNLKNLFKQKRHRHRRLQPHKLQSLTIHSIVPSTTAEASLIVMTR